MFLQFFTANTEPPKVRKEESKSRSALLHEIQRGTRLRKVTQISDRSAPQIDVCNKRASKDGGSSGNGSSDVPQALGNLFADGFPVLRPVGQRDLTANRTEKPPATKTSPPPKVPAPLNNNGRASSNVPISPDGPTATDPSEAFRVQRAIPARPSIPAPPAPVPAPPPPPPPLLPPSFGKPSLVFPPPPSLPPPLLERPEKLPSPNMSAVPSQNDRSPKNQPSPLHVPPPPPPPFPPVSPCGLPGKMNKCSSPSSSQMELKISPPPMPPPPPPPLPGPFMSTFSSPRTSPTCNSALNSSSDSAPTPPANLPLLQSQLQKSPIHSMPPPPTSPSSQPATAMHKRRQGGRGGAKLNPPPLPPARSPTTELTSKCQYTQISPWLITSDLCPTLKNGAMHIMDEFESKFTFHSVEEFPPPDEFKPCQKIYPSQEARGSTNNPPLRTQVR